MKKTQVLFGVVLIAAVSMTLGVTNQTFASNDYDEERGGRHGRMHNGERGERHGRMHNGERGERHGRMHNEGKMKKRGNPEEHIKNIPVTNLNTSEKDLLLKQYEEEMMANELYSAFYEMYGTKVFDKIASSEAHHMDAVQVLLKRYNLDTPTNYDHIKSLYDELKTKGSLSLQDALEVGLMIEKVDIDDIKTAIKNTDNDDIQTIFTFIGGASYNHMRGFAKNIEMQGFDTDVDFSDYLDEGEVNTKGPMQWKLAEELESEGVELPEGATPEAVRAHIEEERKNHSENEMKENHGEMKDMKKEKRHETKRKFRKMILKRFQKKLDSWDDEKLEKIQKRLVVLRTKIEGKANMTEDKKEEFFSMLDALDEIIAERLDGNDAMSLLDEVING